MINYTLIGYLPSAEGSWSRCGYYEHDEQESNLEIYYFQDSHEIVKKWGEMMYAWESARSYPEFTLLCNGLDMSEAEYGSTVEKEWDKISADAQEECSRLRKEKLDKDSKVLEEKRLKEEAEQAVRDEQNRLAKEKRERAEFERLQQKYGYGI
jgi:hypothetical protein